MLFRQAQQEHSEIATMKTANSNGVDLMKFLCAIMVFLIHIPPFIKEGVLWAKYLNFGLQHYFCRLAVPFFFVSSGFFLFRKMSIYQMDLIAVRNYCYKILRLLGTWNLLLITGGTGHLWYLGATAIAIALVSTCFQLRIRLRYICVLACLLYGIGMLGDAYYAVAAPLENIAVLRNIFQTYRQFFRNTRNGVFMGFIFVLMGALLAQFRVELKSKTAAAGFCVSMIGLFAEVYWLESRNVAVEYNMYLFLLPAVFFLFSLAYSIRLKDHPVYRHLRSMGTMIYFTHMLLYKVVQSVFGGFNQRFAACPVRVEFVQTLVLTLLFAVMLQWLSCKEKYQWIRWLF